MKNKTHTIAYIKRQAKKIKRQLNINHTQALDLISKEHGYSNWKHYQKILRQQTTTQERVVTTSFQINFTDWLKKHKNRNSPLGDLVTDMLRDNDWPLYDSLEDYRNYLYSRHASSGAIDALKRAWRTYKAFLKKKNSPISEKPKLKSPNSKNHDPRRIVIVRNITPLHYLNRSIEKFNPADKAWISWNGRKALPVTVLEVHNRHYTIKIERPLKNAHTEHHLFLDEVRSTPELACLNCVTF